MGTNTLGVMQGFAAVPSGDNIGKPSIEDLLELDVKLKRDISTVTIKASEINTASGLLNVAAGKIIDIDMDANITDFDIDGLNGLLDALTNPINANGLMTLIRFIQDGTGTRTVTVKTVTNIDFGTALGSFALSSSAGRIDLAVLNYDKTLNKYFVVGFDKGHNQ